MSSIYSSAKSVCKICERSGIPTNFSVTSIAIKIKKCYNEGNALKKFLLIVKFCILLVFDSS